MYLSLVGSNLQSIPVCEPKKNFILYPFLVNLLNFPVISIVFPITSSLYIHVFINFIGYIFSGSGVEVGVGDEVGVGVGDEVGVGLGDKVGVGG